VTIKVGPSRARRRRGSLVALALALGFVGSTALVESGLRVYHGVRGTFEVTRESRLARLNSSWIASDDPELVYANRPGAMSFGMRRIESHGVIRPDDVAATKAPGGRIVVVGDSVGAGRTVPYERLFTTLCERRLSADSQAGPVEVLNCCVDGYDTIQEVRVLETSALALEPEAVVVLYCMNDPCTTLCPHDWFVDPTPPTSYAVRCLRDAYACAMDRPADPLPAPWPGPVGPAADYWKTIYRPDGYAWKKVLRGFDRIASWSWSRRIPVVVVVMPLLLTDDPGGSSTSGFRSMVMNACAERGITAFDLQSVCSARPIEVLRVEEGDIYHFSVEGHAVVAEALVPIMSQLIRRGPLAPAAGVERPKRRAARGRR
jgi:hypothetical protein